MIAKLSPRPTQAIETVTIVGAGLIGGSLARALRSVRQERRVVCIDRPGKISAIVAAGVADAVATLEQSSEPLAASRLVVLATPIEAILELLPALAPHLAAGTVVTDVGSTKQAICKRAQEVFAPDVHFIGGHPLAGSERSGVGAADPRLFRGRPWFLCPAADTPETAWLAVLDLIEQVGGLPVALAPEEHDELLAVTSHVPQLLALALVHAATAADTTHGFLPLVAGPAFCEMTRIAASPWEVWRGILASNRDAVLAGLERLENSLAALRQAMTTDRLGEMWKELAAIRSGLPGPTTSPRRQADLRAVVERCDVRLLGAVGERFRAVEAIGALKRARGSAVLDASREARLFERWREWGAAEGVPENLLEQLFATVVSASRRIQSAEPG